MKHIVLAAALATLSLGAGPALADPATGTWQTEASDTGGYLHVTVKACGAALCGTIAKAFAADGSASADYEHLGKKMIWDMSADGGGAYSGGKIWAADKNKTYASKMALSGNSLTVKGCVAGGAICRGQTWARVK